mgnify:CR=1 FL=1
MGCINKASISGNLTRDPELRTTQSGTSVLSMGVAVNERVKRGDQWEDRPSYVDATVWGARAEALAKFLRKGLHVAVSGRLRQDRWQDAKTGENRSRLGIVADEVDVMTPRDRGQERQAPAPQQVPQAQQQAVPYAAPAPAQPDPYDEDIPF